MICLIEPNYLTHMEDIKNVFAAVKKRRENGDFVLIVENGMTMKRRRGPVTQEHHISYDPEVVVKIYKGEHWLLTQLQRRTRHISKGLIKSLKVWLALNEDKAVQL